jgi:signal transduction histidine kinase/ligand-binding sensor domain-containing protein/DNA-binding response OmpR family regulator
MEKLTILFIFLYVFANSEAQQDRFYTPYQGLSNTSFNAIAQDNDGFIWIATNGGLNKFDGHNFVIYQNVPLNTNSLNNDAVFSVFVDSKGKVWVGTEWGLHSYNKNTDNFVRYPIKYRNWNLQPMVTAILEDKSNNLWLTTSLGLVKINTRTNELIFFNHKYEADGMIARDLLNTAIFDDNGYLWIASDKNGLFCYDPSKNEFTNYRHEQNSNSICDNSILSLGKDNKGNIIIGTLKGGISIFDKNKKIFNTVRYFHTPANVFNGGVYSIVTNKDGTVWIGTERNGLKKFDPISYTLSDANTNIDLNNISDTKIHCYNDSQGNLWLGIDYAGVYLKKETAKPFFSIRKKDNSPFSLSNNIIKAIWCDHKNNLWIGTDGGGLNYLPDKGKTIKSFLHDPDKQTSIPDNAVISLLEDQKQNLWIGTYLGGLSCFDRRKEKFSTFLIDPMKKGRDLNYVTAILSDTADNLWVATNGGGLQHFDTKQQKFTSYHTALAGKTTVNMPLFLTSLLLDKDKTLWMGSYNGLYSWNSRKATYEAYTVGNGKLESDAIYTLWEDNHGQIWAGTSSGLYAINKKKQVIRHFTSIDGLPNNAVFGILEDAKENLWISTLNGLARFNPETKIFRNYFIYDGLPGNEFRPASCFKAKDGRLYFGSTSGVVYFHPDSIHENSGFPTLALTNFKIFNQTIPIGKKIEGRIILTQSINESSKIVLHHADNNFTIEFAAIDYSAPEKIKYAFLLEGFDQKWIYKDFNQRYATYTNLDPGTYTFKLKTTNSDGLWNDRYKTISIIMEPPFWKTWWAYLIYIAFIFLSFYMTRKLMLFRVTMQNNLQMERLEREKLEELNQSKLQFFSNVSHEFRTPLTLILGPLSRIMGMNMDIHLKKQVEFIHRNAIRLLRLVNLLLDLQKVEKSEMHLRTRLGDIVNFTRDITMSFEELSVQKKISLSFQSEIDRLDMWFDPDKLDKILFNLLSNAIKFTPKGGKITVMLATDKNNAYPAPLNDFVSITVNDTGKGMKEEYLHKIFERFYQIEEEDSEMQVGTGIGLHLSKYLVELHHGKIMVSSKEGEGTRFDILIPRENTYLKPEQKITEPATTVIHTPPELADPVTSESELTEIDIKANGHNNPSSKKAKVLVVEDDYEIRKYIKMELLDHYEILEASDGIEGWSIAHKSMPDLIISDIMMPRMDGIQFCKKIKTEISTSHIPVILLTARTSIENRIEGLETGADSYIPKPFHPKHLLVRVEKLIELRQNLIRKFSKSISFEAKEMTLTSADERFLQKAMDLVKKNLSNADLNIEEMGSELGMSRVHLYRKLKALTDQTPSEFVRTIRLKQAAYLLAQNKLNISEVAYTVGFNSHQYFTNCFQNYFNMSPTEYGQKNMLESHS